MIPIRSRPAFSLLELIIVTVILGIISSIGASLIANVYESYITQRALHRASQKTDLAAKQIAARLTHRINLSVIGRKMNGEYKTIENVDPGDEYRILEWIGYDNDSFSATRIPGWSGFCDINNTSTTKSQIFTPGSNLNSTLAIIGNLGGSDTDAAIIYNSTEYSAAQNYHIYNMGYNSGFLGTVPGITTATISQVTSFDGTNSIISVADSAVTNKVLYDQYKLVWSAYAIVPVQQTDNPNTTVDESKLFDLNLHYNYQPWLGVSGEDYNSTSNISTLVKDVTVFKFKGLGNTIRFKICVQEKISDTTTVNICKEKAVIR